MKKKCKTINLNGSMEKIRVSGSGDEIGNLYLVLFNGQ